MEASVDGGFMSNKHTIQELKQWQTHPKFHNLLYILKNNGVTYAEAIDWVNEHGGFDIKY